VALIAFAVGVAVQTTGALDGLERATLKTRFDIRGAERPDDVVVVAIDAKSFDVLREQWPFPRSLHGKAIRRLHDAGAREIVYDVQFTEPTEPREDLALYDAIEAAGGAVLATSESDERGRTNVLGGDANLRRIGARAAASDLNNDSAGSITRFPREVSGLETRTVVPGSTTAARPAASGPSRSPTSCAIASRAAPSATASWSSAPRRPRCATCMPRPRAATSRWPARRCRPTRSGRPCTARHCTSPARWWASR
jgi:CHASE2 domain-containing sensor protein